MKYVIDVIEKIVKTEKNVGNNQNDHKVISFMVLFLFVTIITIYLLYSI